jgi:predicted peptidase
VVAPSESETMAEAVRDAGGDIRHTLLPDCAHNSWDAAYADPALIQWMLSRHKTG